MYFCSECIDLLTAPQIPVANCHLCFDTSSIVGIHGILQKFVELEILDVNFWMMAFRSA